MNICVYKFILYLTENTVNLYYRYLLTPRNWVLLEKPTGFQLVKKFTAFYGTRRFIPSAKSHVLFPLLRSYQSISPDPRLSLWATRNRICFYGEELLAPHPTPKLEDYPLSAVRDCIFNIFPATLHIGGSSSNRNLRKRHAVATGTHSSRLYCR